MATVLPGFRRLPGTSRRYVNTSTGAELSYRQYRALVEASDVYEPLDVLTLAKRQRQAREYNDLVRSAVKRRQSEALQSLGEDLGLEPEELDDLDPDELARIEREALASVNVNRLKADPQFKADIKLLKEKGHRDPKKMTRSERQEMADALERLGRREGIAKSVQYGDSEAYRKGLVVVGASGKARARPGQRARIKGGKVMGGRRVNATGRNS